MPAVRYDRGMTKDCPFIFLILAISTGAACGAVLRYLLSLWLNPKLSFLPAGTLLCNLTGAFLIGLISAYLSHKTGISPYTKLFLITGFLGSLTTFSTFSLESVNLILHGDPYRTPCHMLLHLAGSVILAFAGIILGKRIFY